MSAVGNQISLGFGWIGAREWRGGPKNGGLDVSDVNLIYDEIIGCTRVRMQENDALHTLQTYQIKWSGVNSKRGTLSDWMPISIDQLRSLKIEVWVRHKCHSYCYPDDPLYQKIHTHSKTLGVGLSLPDKIEAGQNYRLVIKSYHLSLSAELVKEEHGAGIVEQQKKIIVFLQNTLLIPFNMHEIQYPLFSAIELANRPKLCGSEKIKQEIKQMDKNVIINLAKMITDFDRLDASIFLQKKDLMAHIYKELFAQFKLRFFVEILQSSLEERYSSSTSENKHQKIHDRAKEYMGSFLKEIYGTLYLARVLKNPVEALVFLRLSE